MRRPLLLILGAWMLHAVSWFLPVVQLGGAHSALFEPIRGWSAFLMALSPVWPYGDVHADTWYGAALSVVSAATTLAFVIGSPWVVIRGSQSVQKLGAWVAAAAFIFNSHWYVLFGSDREGLRIGYFLWWLSFSLLAIGLFGVSRHRKIHEPTQNEPQRS